MKYRPFSNTSLPLSAIGLGCMGMNHGYGIPDDAESEATLELAVDLGINFWDTADLYANGENERFISKSLSRHRSKIFLASKFGFFTNNKGERDIDGRPEYVYQSIDASLKRLNTDVIDLYYAHRLDPKVPLEDTIGAMSRLVELGKIRYLGLSEVSADSLRKAHAIHPISALQSEYSIMFREMEDEIIPLCKSLQISFVPFSPLARGYVTNTLDINALADNDFRKNLPRYKPEYLENNKSFVSAILDIASTYHVTPAQLSLAWILHRSDHIIPIPGTKKRKYLIENGAAADISIQPSDMNVLNELIYKYPNIGARYDEVNERFLDRR